MSLRVALLRSMVINGHRIRMEDVRGFAAQAGGQDVRSVIATGNLVFRSREAPATLERELEAACQAFYGKPTEVVVKRAEEWRALIAANPFDREAALDPSRLLVWVMRERLPDAGLEQLRRRARGDEQISRTASGDFYMWFGTGAIADSKLPAGFGLRALGAVGTNRNWNTAMKISAVLDAMDRE